jgi:hypothetical protein
VRESFFVSFLGGLGVAAEPAFATGFLFFLLSTALALPGAAIVLWQSARGPGSSVRALSDTKEADRGIGFRLRPERTGAGADRAG